MDAQTQRLILTMVQDGLGVDCDITGETGNLRSGAKVTLLASLR